MPSDNVDLCKVGVALGITIFSAVFIAWAIGGGMAALTVFASTMLVPLLVVLGALIALYGYLLCVGMNSLPMAPRNAAALVGLLAALIMLIVGKPLCWLTSSPATWWLPAVLMAILVMDVWSIKLVRLLFLANPVRWPMVAGPVIGTEFEDLCTMFEQRCATYAAKYPMQLRVEAAWRIINPGLERAFAGYQEELKQRQKSSDCRMLFHGTSLESAVSITNKGFQLPRHGGMFGKGLYFADCPLKSWQYVGRPGVMLACNVELGNSMLKRSAGCNPSSDLRRSWAAKLIGGRSYDSLTAVDGFLGCVRVPEYVVYRPEQALPRFVLQLRKL